MLFTLRWTKPSSAAHLLQKSFGRVVTALVDYGAKSGMTPSSVARILFLGAPPPKQGTLSLVQATRHALWPIITDDAEDDADNTHVPHGSSPKMMPEAKDAQSVREDVDGLLHHWLPTLALHRVVGLTLALLLILALHIAVLGMLLRLMVELCCACCVMELRTPPVDGFGHIEF